MASNRTFLLHEIDQLYETFGRPMCRRLSARARRSLGAFAVAVLVMLNGVVIAYAVARAEILFEHWGILPPGHPLDGHTAGWDFFLAALSLLMASGLVALSGWWLSRIAAPGWISAAVEPQDDDAVRRILIQGVSIEKTDIDDHKAQTLNLLFGGQAIAGDDALREASRELGGGDLGLGWFHFLTLPHELANAELERLIKSKDISAQTGAQAKRFLENKYLQNLRALRPHLWRGDKGAKASAISGQGGNSSVNPCSFC